MTKNFEDQSKSEKNNNNKKKIIKNDNTKQELIQKVEKRLEELEEQILFTDYDQASKEDKQKLKQYASSLKGQEAKWQEQVEAFKDNHDEANRQHAKYILNQVQLLKTSLFLDTVLQSLYWQQVAINHDFEIEDTKKLTFCSSNWKIVKNTSRIDNLKEQVISKIATNIFRMFENDDWAILLLKKD